ncbi:hypothetical protein LVY75_04915 (plasmid) [Sinorhizobium sp. B11]
MYPHSGIEITAAIAHRLIDLIGVRLPIPVAPLSGESIADLILRSASINRLPTTNLFFPKIKRPLSHNLLANSSFDFGPVADILGCPNGSVDLVPMQYTRQRPGNKGGRGLFNFFGAMLPTKQLINHRRVAPRSMAISNHSKAIWHISALTFDAQTRERLLENCPVCERLLDFRHPVGVSRCPHCGPGIDLRDFPQNYIESSDEEALRFVCGLIDPEANRSAFTLHDELCRVNRGEIFMLSVIIAAVLDGHARKTERKKYWTGVSVSPSSLALSGRALMRWPHGVAALGEQFVEGLIPASKSLDRHPLEAILRQTKMFNVSTVASIRSALLLPRVQVGFRDSVPARVPSQVSLLNLHKHAKRSPLVGEMSREIGVPRGVLFECFLSHSLPCPDQELSAAIGAPNAKLAIFEERLYPNRIRSSAYLSVRGTVSALYRGPANPWPLVFDALLKNLLPITRTPSRTLLDGLYVQDFAPWINFCNELPSAPNAPEFRIDWEEVGFHLDLTKSSVVAKLGSFYRSGDLASLRRLYGFRSKFVSIREVYNRLLIVGRPRAEAKLARMLDSAGVRCSAQQPSYRLRADVEDFLTRFCSETAV